MSDPSMEATKTLPTHCFVQPAERFGSHTESLVRTTESFGRTNETMATTTQPSPTHPNHLLVETSERPPAWEIHEGMLVRMLIDTVRFPTIRLPQLLYEFLLDAFPWVIRFVRIVLFLGLILAAIFGPFAYALNTDLAHDLLSGVRLHLIVSVLQSGEPWTTRLCCTWTAVSLIGSVRGAVLYRKRIQAYATE